MTDQRFTLRVAVKTLGEEPIAGLDPGSGFQVGRVRVSIARYGRYLVLKAGDFVTEEEAREFLPCLQAGLWNLALEYNVAFIPDFEPREINRSSNPETAGCNLAANFALAESPPVHGLAGEGGTTIFRADERIQFLSVGGTGRVSTPLNEVIRVLAEGVDGADISASPTDETFSTAVNLIST